MDQTNQIKIIANHFSNKKIAIRSSALCEDGAGKSHAGEFTSILNINPASEHELYQAIETVFASYPELRPDDQVLIQEMVRDIEASGVILTRCVDDGSPYYVLNYDDETGHTDSITSGRGVHKTVLVYRKYKPEYCDSERVRKMLNLAGEMEAICGNIPLDIEFALDKSGIMHLLQVRRISTVKDWHPDAEHRVSRIIPHIERFVDQQNASKKRLFGRTTVFGNMPDWNPAELIGAIPSPLAASLFRRLISGKAWSTGRHRMGYRELPRTDLMVLIGGRVYIDVRASFNSFLPDGIPETIGEKLVNAWLQRLADNPSLHDKVEFEVAQTALDFCFEENYTSRYKDVLTHDEKQIFTGLLKDFTNKALSTGSLNSALEHIEELSSRQSQKDLTFDTDSPIALSAFINSLLEDCLNLGTIPFTIIARHGFIAESLLRSCIQKNALSKERVSIFKSSFSTIMGDLARDTKAVHTGEMENDEFMETYGHLRPGTFDIMSLCYRHRSDLFTSYSGKLETAHEEPSPFRLTPDEKKKINLLLLESGLTSSDANALLDYARKAIQNREYAKFIFTRHLSAALEAIAAWGELHNLGREDLSYLKIEDILEIGYASTRSDTTSLLMHKVEQAGIDVALSRVLKLSYLVRGVRDIHVVPVHRSEPNFITNKKIKSRIKLLLPSTVHYENLKDRIICIENADPGFDWIFTRGIAGLITKYGGANSHMAIRCAELQLPAAIGCGDDLFERLRDWDNVHLDCGAGLIRRE